VIIGEMDISLKGLGGLIQDSGDSFQTAPLLAAIISSSLVGVVGTVILEVLRRRIAPWSAAASDVHTKV
jgi:NitT/TauT family transport system permease protein